MGIKRKLNLIGQKIYKNRANIAFYTGTAMNAGATVLFIYETHMIEPDITDYKLKMVITSKSDKETRKKLVRDIMIKSGKRYALPTGLYICGTALQLYSNTQHNKTNAALSSALTVATVGTNAIKDRIIEKYGENAWKEVNGASVKTDINPETGEKKEEFSFEDDKARLYTMIPFDENNKNFSKLKGANRMFLKMQVEFANEDLQKKGVIHLTDFLSDYLGYDLKPGADFDKDQINAMSKAGWFYKNEDGSTNTIDIGLGGYDYMTEKFMKDEVDTFMMDLNCCAYVDRYI